MSKLIINRILERGWENLHARAKIIRGAIPAYWWEGHKNFGDLITPFLVKWLTGRPPLNLAGLSLKPTSILCSTGSILHGLDRRTFDIWGSGFIAPQERSPARVQVHALRGPLSGKVANRLGWGDPGKYCDPGLTLPMIIPAQPPQRSFETNPRIALVPHYALIDSTACDVIGVSTIDPSQTVEELVPQLLNADIVVSSSLHGLVVAQAYGRPWVWLRDHKNVLTGGDFKFRDFFESIGVSPRPLTIDGRLTRRTIDLCLRNASLASPESVRERQKDFLESAPGVVWGTRLDLMKKLV